MAKTGSGEQLGTAEGAIMSRAIHARHADHPILDDDWAIELLTPENRARVLASSDAASIEVTPGFDASPIFALGVASLRYAEDEVERCVARGIAQYLILGAKSRAELVTAARALDRVLRAGHYWVLHWYKAAHHLAFWDKLGRPKTKPRYARGVIETWWYEADKAAKLKATQ